MIWGVVAPINDVGPGTLAKCCGGVTAAIAVGYGVRANVLIGRSQNIAALQLLRVEASKAQTSQVASKSCPCMSSHSR